MQQNVEVIFLFNFFCFSSYILRASREIIPIAPAIEASSMDFLRIEPSSIMPQSMIATSNDPPAGYEIKETVGIVTGTSVRSRNLFSCICGGLRAICGGSNEFMRTLLVDLQTEACNNMIEAAHSKGANAIICVRFSAVDVGMLCSGTAVKVAAR